MFTLPPLKRKTPELVRHDVGDGTEVSVLQEVQTVAEEAMEEEMKLELL